MTHSQLWVPRSRVALAWVMFCASCCVAACGGQDHGDPQASAPPLALEASLGSAPDEASEAVVMWNVTSGEPDYLYLWGRASVEGDSFKLVLHSRPPAAAMNNSGLGVGMIMLAPRSAGFRDGMQSDADEGLYENFRGASERQAIIYVDREQANARIEAMSSTLTADELKSAREHWLFDFPPGYSCGTARAAQSGEAFDGYAPIDCSKVEVRLGKLEEFEFPNWS